MIKLRFSFGITFDLTLSETKSIKNLNIGEYKMNLVRWNNQARFSNVFDQLFNEAPYYKADNYATSKPAANIKETEEGFKLELAIPGLEKKDVKINLENNVLSISSENVNQSEENYSRKEFAYQTFSRSFSLPKSVNVEKIKADHKNGILNISLPKKEEAKVKLSREIKIS